MTGTATVIRGNALDLPLADNTVDLIITSPPYFGLRSYQDGGEHYDGQLGSEATPAEFVDALIAATAEMVRVVKPSGSIFVNLGDKYASGGGLKAQSFADPSSVLTATRKGKRTSRQLGVPEKSLTGIPWRYALRCIDDLGLILRAEIIWEKGNGLPESVRDRVRRSHETWFHFVLKPNYFSAVDEIRLPTNTAGRAGFTPPSRPALGPELAATIRTDDGPSVTRGWCRLGSLKQPIRPTVTGDAERFQVAELVGFDLRIEGAERDYVVDLQPVGGPALDTAMTVALQDALAYLSPSDSSPRLVTSDPSGVLVSGPVVDDALGRAEVLRLEVAPVATEGVAARITLDLHPGRASLLVWDAFASRHDNILPRRSDALGKLPGSVWHINTEPLTVPAELGVDHFAAFPTAWPKRLIQGWSPAGVCTVCGEGRRPVTRSVRRVPNDALSVATRARTSTASGTHVGSTLGYPADTAERVVTGYACACPDTTAPTTPSVILDPFGGTGTTALVAKALGRTGISVDMSFDYCRLATWRTNDRNQLAHVLDLERIPAGDPAQLDLFGEVSA